MSSSTKTSDREHGIGIVLYQDGKAIDVGWMDQGTGDIEVNDCLSEAFAKHGILADMMVDSWHETLDAIVGKVKVAVHDRGGGKMSLSDLMTLAATLNTVDADGPDA